MQFASKSRHVLVAIMNSTEISLIWNALAERILHVHLGHVEEVIKVHGTGLHAFMWKVMQSTANDTFEYLNHIPEFHIPALRTWDVETFSSLYLKNLIKRAMISLGSGEHPQAIYSYLEWNSPANLNNLCSLKSYLRNTVFILDSGEKVCENLSLV